jgi:DNA-binding response OmpR family regulator/Tfp pilus assembly protein PilZ
VTAQEGSVQELVSRWLGFRLERESKSSVLLAYPDIPIRQVMVQALSNEELNVMVVGNASDAIETLETDSASPEGRVDLVVAHSNLRDLTGVELMQFIRSRPYQPELLLVADEPSEHELNLVVSLALADYLTGEEGQPREVAAKARRLKEVALNRRVREMMVSDLRTTLQEMLPKGETLLAQHLERRIAAYRDELGPMDRVLVAEGDTRVRAELASALGDTGIKVEVAMGGQSALMLMEEEKPDAVVVDPAMAEMTEVEFLKRARETAPDVEVVLLARSATLEDARNALKYGVADFILKPVADPQMAAQRIKRVLEHRRQEKAVDLLITELYGMAASAVASGPAEDEESTRRLFEGLVPEERIARAAELPPEFQPQGTAGDAAAGAGVAPGDMAVEIHTGEVVELHTGEYDLVAMDELYGGDHQAIPDLAVLNYVDELLFDDGAGITPMVSPGSSGAAWRMPGGGRRTMPRVERSFMVTFGPADSPRGALGFLRDLSLGGLFISAEPPLLVGQEVRMEIQIPTAEGLERISCQGKVVWNTLQDTDKVEIYGHGFGVEFTVRDSRGSDLLRKVVAGEMSPRDTPPAPSLYLRFRP